jgi:hypothetical protein
MSTTNGARAAPQQPGLSAREVQLGYEFWPSGLAPPSGEWEYELDDHEITFGRGWWPFHRETVGGQLETTAVRVAPNTTYQSWGNEYVLLEPDGGSCANATLELFVRAQGRGVVIGHGGVRIDIRSRAVSVDRGCPPPLRDQAEMKATRLLAFLLAARASRRSGLLTPRTAHMRWIEAGGQ